MEDLDKIIERVRTLLAIADGGSPYEPEREMARERAERLMLRHSIDTFALQVTSGSRDEPQSTETWVEGPYLPDKIALLVAIYDVFGCKCLSGRPVRSAKTLLRTYGFIHDLRMGALLGAHLMPQMFAAMSAHGGSGAVRKSFARGFTDTVHQRLTAFYADALKESEAPGAGTELVLFRKENAVGLAVAKDRPRSGSARVRAFGHGAAQEAGNEAGKEAEITMGNRVLHSRPPGR